MGDGERKKDELTVYSLLDPLGVLQFAAGRAGGIIINLITITSTAGYLSLRIIGNTYIKS